MTITQILIALFTLEFGVIVTLMFPLVAGQRAYRQGRYEKAQKWFLWCYRVSRILKSWRGTAALNVCACHLAQGDYVSAMPFAEEAVAELENRNVGYYLAVARAYLGLNLCRFGEFDKARPHFEAALAEKRLPARYRHWVEIYAANLFAGQGRFDRAVELLQQALAVQRLDPEMRVLAETLLAGCDYHQGRLPEALDRVRKASAETFRTPWIHAAALSDYMLYLAESGQTKEAQEVEARLIPYAPRSPEIVQGGIYLAIATLALRNEDLDRARDYAERAYPLDRDPNAQAAALLVQAEVFAARHNGNRAQALCNEALRLNTIPFYRDRAEGLMTRMADPAGYMPEHIAEVASVFTPTPAVEEAVTLENRIG